MTYKKDLSSVEYWATFGDLGANIGRAFMPSPKEAADTVLTLMQERAQLAAQVAALEQRIKAVVGNLAVFCMKVANEADALRDAARDSHTNTGGEGDEG